VSSIVTRVEPIVPSELYSQMLSYELCLDKQSSGGFSAHSSANVASRGCGTPWHSGNNNTSSHGRGASSSGNCGGFNNSTSYRRGSTLPSMSSGGNSCSQCQVCLKIGHTSSVYWYRYDEDYVPTIVVLPWRLLPPAMIPTGILIPAPQTTSRVS
jgi:hypothetical protein